MNLQSNSSQKIWHCLELYDPIEKRFHNTYAQLTIDHVMTVDSYLITKQKLLLPRTFQRKTKCVIAFVRNHTNAIDNTQESKKPLLIYDYNKSKGGVDRLDECVETFSVRRKTTRWPLLLFFNLIDVACYNSFVIMTKSQPSLQRKAYMKALSFQLGETYANSVRLKRSGLHSHIVTAARLVGYAVNLPAMSQPNQDSKPGRCHACQRKCRSFCQICSLYACPAHRKLVKTVSCFSCQNEPH